MKSSKKTEKTNKKVILLSTIRNAISALLSLPSQLATRSSFVAHCQFDSEFKFYLSSRIDAIVLSHAFLFN